MATYETIPRRVEAEQWDGWTSQMKGVCICKESAKPHVHTTHNNQLCEIEKGDYIIPEPNGVNYYPCKPEIFNERHRLVNE